MSDVVPSAEPVVELLAAGSLVGTELLADAGLVLESDAPLSPLLPVGVVTWLFGAELFGAEVELPSQLGPVVLPSVPVDELPVEGATDEGATDEGALLALLGWSLPDMSLELPPVPPLPPEALPDPPLWR